MPNTHMLLHLITTYGYPSLTAALFIGALGIGVPIPVTVLLITLGALSGAPEGPSFAALALAGLLGATSGHTVDYWCGRLGNRLVARWLARGDKPTRVSDLWQRAMSLRGGRAAVVFATRFVFTAIASPISLFAGVTQMPFGFYLCLEVVGEVLYVLGNLTLGRIFGVVLLSHGPGMPVFWIVLALLTLLPVALARPAARLLSRAHPDAPARVPEPSEAPVPVQRTPAGPVSS